MVTKGTNAYQCVLESWYDVSVSYRYGGKFEVRGGCGYIACARRGANLDWGCHSVDVSTGSGGGDVYNDGTAV